MLKAVISKVDGSIRRFGYQDFAAEGAGLDPVLEEVVDLVDGQAIPTGEDKRQWTVKDGSFEKLETQQSLDTAKQLKCDQIDMRTKELILRGFEHPASSGQFFSLSIEGQTRVHGVMSLRNDPTWVYPVRWNTVDDLGVHELKDAAEVEAFFHSGANTLRARVDSGTELKNAVRAAQTLEEVAAVVDGR